ncbi:MAG TPA: hypothetical protein VF403_20505 [Kofleriaceae bacterium]|jgi:hypothetical protein
MAGYSGTPLPQKLGIKPDSVVAILAAPPGFPIAGKTTLAGKMLFDVIVVFVKSKADLVERIATLRPRMQPACGLWIAFPKKASKVVTDVTEHVVREVALPTGLVDNKVCAIDEVYTGLRLVIRVELR